MRTLNLGILAHVDAGKTTLTERLLYAAGVIDEIGSVDKGTTQTDTLELERQRGITIRSAVASFAIDGVTVNLIDTPGHPDFIAEVERVLGVLDGVVLVISAVEGVQAQTRVLMRTLRRLRIPTLLFVNKIDRGGADSERTMRGVREKLTPAAIAMGTVRDAGTRAAGYLPFGAGDTAFLSALAGTLGDHDDTILAAYVADEASVSYRCLRDALARQTGQALVYPVFFGSAITGAGLEALMGGIAELLPAAEGDAEGPVSGTVFKVERGPAGEKIANIRLFSGTLRTRDRLPFGRDHEAKVTAISVFDRGPAVRSPAVSAGQIGRLWGLAGVQIGDAIGVPRMAARHHYFAPPALETMVAPVRPADKGALLGALIQLAEQDPLINLHQDDVRGEIFISLYSEVQKEVVEATLANDFGIAVEFHGTRTLCIERPAGSGAAAEFMGKNSNPFLATIGLRVDPAPPGSCVAFRLEVELGSIRLSFHKAVEEAVFEALRQGLYGWPVTDCTITMTHSGYAPRQSHAHARFDKSMSSTGSDFRYLTPLVLMSALKRAGTAVYEPWHHFQLEIPADLLGPLLPALARLDALPQSPAMRGAICVLEGEIPAARVYELQQALPALTRGEGVLECAFDRYQPVSGTVPTRPRTDHNPLDRKEYLLHVTRRV